MKLCKKTALSFLIVLCIGGLGLYAYMQVLGDIRTDHAKTHGASASAQEEGRALLARSIENLGGAENWNHLREQAVKITFRHTWHDGFLRAFFMPLEFSGQELTFLLRPGHLDSRLTFLDGEWKGRAWGIFEGKTYEVDSDGGLSWERDETIEFHVLGYRYFFFLPFHLLEAEMITYAGARELHGKTYDLVYATWGAWEPQRAVDQYLVWINRETSMVDHVQSTVRDMFARSIVSCSLADYRDVLGVRLPFSLKVFANIDDLGDGMHHMEVLQVERAADEDSKLLRVNRSGEKD